MIRLVWLLSDVSSELWLRLHFGLACSHLTGPHLLFSGVEFGNHSVSFLALLSTFQESWLLDGNLRLAVGGWKLVLWLKRVFVQDDLRASYIVHLVSLVLKHLLLEAVRVRGDLHLLNWRERASPTLLAIPHGCCEVIHLWSLVGIANLERWFLICLRPCLLNSVVKIVLNPHLLSGMECRKLFCAIVTNVKLIDHELV